MSANVDQRSKGQPSQVSNGNGKDVMKEEDPYIQQAPQHPVRSWSDQASDGAYGAAPMSTAGVSDSFFHNYYAPNMSYPFISQGLSGSEASWSNSADSMFGMGYDYSNVYGGFGFPFNNWDYPSDYWSGSQPVRKDQRGYADDPYYAPEMIPTDSYGMMNGTAPPQEPQEPIGTVEQGLRAMSIAQPTSAVVDSRKKMVDMSQPPILTDGFGGGDPSLMMPPTMSSNSAPGVISGGSGGGGHGSSKKTSWAAIASQPARPQQQMRPRTIPRAPVHPNKSMDIGTWDTRGNPAKPPMSMTQTLPSQPPPPRQSWATNSVRSRPIQPHSTSGPGNMTGPSSGSSNSSSNNLNSNTNSAANNSNSNNTSSNNSNANNNSNNVVAPASNSGNVSGGGGGGGQASSYASYPNSAGNNMGSRNAVASNTTTNGSHGEAPASALSASHPILDQLKSSNLYNPKEFNLNPKSARFFVIKSYSEDDIHRSIKYNIWCSTEHGNKRLDQAFREREGKGPVYLIYSVNGSGHFCGIAQMMSPVDTSRSAGVWAQDKWKGQMEVKWVYVKDVPNNQLRHIRLENNENKPVTNSRDTQEVPPEKGKQVLRIMHSYKHLTSIFDDFIHYEKRQEEDQHQPHQPSMHGDKRGDHHSGYNNHRDNRGGGGGGGGGDHDRDGHHHRNDHFRNDGRGDGRGDHRYDNRGGGDYRGDGREHRGGFDRDHRDRGDGRNNRDNRRGGRPN